MKIKQHPYLSAEAKALRARDGIPPWGVHPCEVDALRQHKADNSVFGDSLRAAAEMRRQLENPQHNA